MARFLILLLLMGAGCGGPEQEGDIEGLPLRPEQIQRWFPPNATIAEAQRIMERRGFECRPMLIASNQQPSADSLACTRCSSNYVLNVTLHVQKGRPVWVLVQGPSGPAIPKP